MATNPNFTPPQVAPNEESRTTRDAVDGRDDEVNETKEYASPTQDTADDLTAESNSQEHDPNKLGVYRMSNTFLDWVLKNPVPKDKEENLWKDTLPPGYSAADIKREPTAPPSSAFSRPVRARRKVPLLVIGGGVLLLVGGLFAAWPTGGDKKAESSASRTNEPPDVNGPKETRAEVEAQPAKMPSTESESPPSSSPPRQAAPSPRSKPPAPSPTFKSAPHAEEPSSTVEPKETPKPTSAPSAPRAFTPEL